MVNQKAEHGNTQQSILQAAEKEFLKYGYDAAKTVRIAAAAGVTHAMLHYYFGTKQKLFDKVFEEKARLLGQSLALPLVNDGRPLHERIEQMVNAHFDFIAANPDLPRFIINELASNPERLTRFREMIRKIARPMLEQMQQEADMAAMRGEIRKTDIFDLTIDMVSLNIFPFLAMPVICAVREEVADNMQAYIISRRRESAEMILQRIKP